MNLNLKDKYQYAVKTNTVSPFTFILLFKISNLIITVDFWNWFRLVFLDILPRSWPWRQASRSSSFKHSASPKPRFTPCPASGWILCAASLWRWNKRNMDWNGSAPSISMRSGALNGFSKSIKEVTCCTHLLHAFLLNPTSPLCMCHRVCTVFKGIEWCKMNQNICCIPACSIQNYQSVSVPLACPNI